MRKVTYVCDLCGLHKRSVKPEGWLRIYVAELGLGLSSLYDPNTTTKTFDVCSHACALENAGVLLDRSEVST